MQQNEINDDLIEEYFAGNPKEYERYENSVKQSILLGKIIRDLYDNKYSRYREYPFIDNNYSYRKYVHRKGTKQEMNNDPDIIQKKLTDDNEWEWISNKIDNNPVVLKLFKVLH